MSDERAANATDRKIGERVRSRRQDINMSQEKLAELLGVTFQQVQKYEKGVNRIAASRLLDIANALEISVCRFFDGLHAHGVAEDRQEYIHDAMATPEGAQLMAVFAAIKTQKVRRKVVDLVKMYLDDDGKR